VTTRDPLQGVRGVFAATLVLESVVVLLALLVLAKFGAGATPLRVGVIVGLAVAMVVAAGLQRRPWGLALALALQVVMVVCGLLVAALAVLGVVFGLVWAGLLLLRRDLVRKMARGELPGQQR
jgi:MFS superfamily sulfate permease-like transporter